ncbi:hypothetical protein TNCV_1811671 [Trichonephila clavipes]|nr:hypothetical protein TNCV_1811671 [Trichonephila clavipes]
MGCDRATQKRPMGRRLSIAGIAPSRHSRRAARLLVRLVEGEDRWEATDHPQDVLPRNWGGNEQNLNVTCMVLKAKANDRRKNLALSLYEFS